MEPVGRYSFIGEDNKLYYRDVIFEKPDDNLSNFINCNIGYYGIWTYDIKSTKISKLTMEWVNELPENKRNKRSVIRHLMSKMCSENSNNALMVGKWQGSYTEDGKSPHYWINSSSIFEKRIKTGQPVKYGQCWCFAECLTSMLRYLNIPCRTVCGTNIMIDQNLDSGVDFKQDLRKDETSDNILLRLNSDYIRNLFSSAINGVGFKSELDDLKIYDCGDSTWNLHYWNEVWIDDHWEVIDSTPVLESLVKLEDEDKPKKILGPSSLLNETPESLDFDRFHAMINSPYRLWATETIIEDDQLITIPYVYSVIFPHSVRNSRYLKLPKIMSLFSKGPKVSYKNNNTVVDITSSYVSDDRNLRNKYLGELDLDPNSLIYFQTVYLDYFGNVLSVDRFKGTLLEHKSKEKHEICGVYLISCLAVKIEQSKTDETDETDETDGTPKFFAFCEYAKNEKNC